MLRSLGLWALIAVGTSAWGADARCPAGLSAKEGDVPKLVAQYPGGRKLILCGQSAESEFNVHLLEASQPPKQVFEASATHSYTAGLTSDHKLKLTEKVFVAGANREAFEFEFECSSSRCWPGDRRCVLKVDWKRDPSKVSALKRRLSGQGTEEMQTVVSDLLAEAMAGDLEAGKLLNDRRWDKKVDGASAEELITARRWYKVAAKALCFVGKNSK